MNENREALSAYDNALAFSHASEIMYSRFEQALSSLDYKDASLAIPFMVNCAFACELFLKALIDYPPKGHNLSKLFQKLLEYDSPTAESIKKAVILSFCNSNKPLERSFEDELILNGDVFEQFRYYHEPGKVGEYAYNYLFLFVLMLMLKAHAEQKYGKRPLPKTNE